MVGELPAEYRRSFSVQLSTQHLVNIHIPYLEVEWLVALVPAYFMTIVK